MNARPFGTLPSGEPVTAHTLRGDGGLTLECLDYGGIVTRLLAPDRHGRLADVVLGFDTLEGYLAPQPYLGALVGRVAGRISNARFTLDGRSVPLAANDGANHLHGGRRGFDKHLWSATATTRPDGAPALRLTRTSPDGEEGYPGNLTVAVTYAITADNAFHIESEARTDAPTPFSLTHHAYFNLGGHTSGTVAEHTLEIAADRVVPADADLTLLGRAEPVAGCNDLRTPRRLGAIMPGLHLRHGDLYLLPDHGGARRTAARLAHAASGRILTVVATASCLQLYTGAFLDGSLRGKSGHAYARHAGLCLECEDYPDAPNTPALGDITLRPGRVARHATTYAFTAA